MKLYDLTTEYLHLLDVLEDEDASEEAIRDTMGMILEDITDKIEDCGKVLKQLRADAEALKAEKLRLASRQAAIERGEERLREAIRLAMAVTNQRKIKTGLFTFGLTKQNKVVLDVPEESLPIEFQKVTVKADTKALKEYLMRDEADLCGLAHFETVETLSVR